MELLNYFENHKNGYLIPQKVSFTHIYFSPDLRGNNGAKAAATQALTQLNKKDKKFVLSDIGDPFSGQSDYCRINPKRRDTFAWSK
jgi:hypothetical protein